MMIDKELLKRCNEKEGVIVFDHDETGQCFVLLTLKKYKELTLSTGRKE